jgi:hypothetical protein
VTPLSTEQAKVIRTWRVDLGCSWGRVDELAEKVWGFRMGPGELCEHAARVLGENPGEEPWN